jgi:anti-sigma B factor antagonist
MNICTRDSGQVRIVDLVGNLDTNTSPQAEAEISRLTGEGTTKIVANLEKLDYISSSGLRVLLATTKKLRGSSGDLRICNLNEMVQEVFDISGFSTILSVFATETDALEGF